MYINIMYKILFFVNYIFIFYKIEYLEVRLNYFEEKYNLKLVLFIFSFIQQVDVYNFLNYMFSLCFFVIKVDLNYSGWLDR